MAAVSAALLAKVDESENLQQNGKKKLLHVAPDKR
jgi:hypothetical protein